jgi:hypothetical protein
MQRKMQQILKHKGQFLIGRFESKPSGSFSVFLVIDVHKSVFFSFSKYMVASA